MRIHGLRKRQQCLSLIKVRFIPITNEQNKLLGIVTQQAVFKEYQKIFGNKHNSMAIYTYDIRGVLGKICELIAKEAETSAT